MEKWQIELNEQYKALVETGLDKKIAQKICLSHLENKAHIEETKESLTLRRQLPLKELNEVEFIKERGGFSNLAEKAKKKLLWVLGFDTHNFPYAVDLGYYTFNDRRYFGEFIVGQERSDNEWVGRKEGDVRFCSYEAILKNKNHFQLQAEIDKMLGK